MAITINEKHCYPQSSNDLFKIYVEQGWIPQRYEGVGMRNIEIIQCDQSGDTYTVKTKREVRANAPKALAKFAKEWNLIEQTEVWTDKGDGVYSCQFEVNLVGIPVDMGGVMVVQPDDEGSANVIEMTISCGIPLVGKIAEKFVAGDTDKSMQQEHAWIKDFLNAQC